ncbi:hypothetical protein VFPPC_18140 [Pochonia chlamydosporia 170]|uniref:Uncharacterized protein n=1 Tax=Pochonia chlamydosporia 170 TaxID=1380566 RepID=A0A219APH4_METCM|nr:hypothetical protein VFPPC_18140 [Pochonia chlamydosporia 170]OWT42727.1 hypothetical protein VFPPC_18140 [Pochonia chlamydosporia 170]
MTPTGFTHGLATCTLMRKRHHGKLEKVIAQFDRRTWMTCSTAPLTRRLVYSNSAEPLSKGQVCWLIQAQVGVILGTTTPYLARVLSYSCLLDTRAVGSSNQRRKSPSRPVVGWRSFAQVRSTKRVHFRTDLVSPQHDGSEQQRAIPIVSPRPPSISHQEKSLQVRSRSSTRRHISQPVTMNFHQTLDAPPDLDPLPVAQCSMSVFNVPLTYQGTQPAQPRQAIPQVSMSG